jgi:hypothetical protein
MNAIRELVESEISYVGDLTTLCDVFKADCAKLMTPAEAAAVFSNCDALRGINSELLQARRSAAE